MIDEEDMQKIVAHVRGALDAQVSERDLVNAALAVFLARADELQRESELQLLSLPYAVQVGYGPSMRKGYADAREVARERIQQFVSDIYQRELALREAQDMRTAGRLSH